ncbi:MAG: hypothetical protein DELT_00563 [Desulfovibrio sp.]
MHRRNFLKLLGAGSIATAAAPGVAQAASATISSNPDAIGVLHDSTLCIGCRYCEKACATINSRPAPEKPYEDLSVLEKRRRPSVESYTVVNKYAPENSRPVFRKIQCNHCLEPACASACFVKAFIKNPDGSVTYDPSLCVGCRYCMIACPYNIPSYSYNKALNPVVHKCTLCETRLLEGKLPGCVEICPTGALLFGKRTALLRIAHERLLKSPGKYVDHVYGEKEMGGSSWLYLSPVPHEMLGQPVLGATSVPELTSGALGSVPFVAGLWPVLLGGAYAITKRKEKIAAEEQAHAVENALRDAAGKADTALQAALAKAEKDKETALTNAAKAQEVAHEAALKAKDEELAAAVEEARQEAEAKITAAQKAAAKGKSPAKTSAKTPAKKAAPKKAPARKEGLPPTDKEDS